MDEPLDNLDIQARDFFLKIMDKHVADGGAILQTSHEPVEYGEVIEVEL
jgi:ABC-type transport system involved in cytochrome c biogenesis ATPase subunit